MFMSFKEIIYVFMLTQNVGTWLGKSWFILLELFFYVSNCCTVCNNAKQNLQFLLQPEWFII